MKISLQSLVTPELFEKIKNVLNYQSKSSLFMTTPLREERRSFWKSSASESTEQIIEQGKRGDVEIYLTAPVKRKCRWCEANFNFKINPAVIELGFRTIDKNYNYIRAKYTSLWCLSCFKLYLRKLVDLHLRLGENAIPEGYKNLPDEVISSIIDSLPELPKEVSACILSERLEGFKK